MSFILALPRISISGQGAIADAAATLAREGARNVLVLTDRVLHPLPSTEAALVLLTAAGLKYEVFDAIDPNPTVANVEAAFAVYAQMRPDAVVALGGGSVIDTAKAVRILSANPGPINQYEGVHLDVKPGVKLVAINTTSGTAAEVTSNAVITDTVRRVKMVIIAPAIIPDIAVNDPAVLVSMPASTTAATGMDALTHAIEAYVSVGAHPLTDHSALEAIRIICKWLPVAYRDGADLQAREMMAHGQFIAGMAFNSAGLGCVHSLAHQPGATHGLAHGVSNAILLPVVETFNRDAAVARFATVAAAMGVDTAGMSQETASLAALDAIRALSRQVNIPAGLSAFGIKESDIEQWVKPALADPCTGGNPKPITADDVRRLYRQAL
jgi:alcohol dehydrogenase class IV